MTDISERSLKILQKLVERYIAQGQPVGSKILAQDSSLMLSSATIRHIMAELEEAGYLHSPHTSSGRIPTSRGYRLFVDNFITLQAEPVIADIKELRQQLGTDSSAIALVNKASSLLSTVTHLVGIVALPKQERLNIKLIEFLPLAKNRVLVVLVFNEQDVQNRIIVTEREYTPSELEAAGNFLTTHFIGKDLSMARKELLNLLRADRIQLDQMLQTVMDIAERTFEITQQEDYVLAGETNLFAAVDESQIQNLRALFEAFERKRDILHLLDQALQAQGIQIYIGEESGQEVFDDYSVVTAPYQQNDKFVGVLAVIGPTRMQYRHVVSAVDITAKLLSQALAIN